MRKIALASAVALVSALAWAAAPKVPVVPENWRTLRFGMTEAEVQKQVLSYREGDRPWEKLPLTAMPVPDVAGRKVARVDLDEKRFHAWMISQLDSAVSTARAWFDHGKLVAFQVMVVDFDRDEYAGLMARVYDAEPEKVTFRFEDRTQGASEPAKELPVALWRGEKVTALVFQTSGWGPELLLVSNAALPAIQKAARP